MAADSFNTKVENDQTRASLGKRLGEIITDLLGDKRIQELYENGAKPDTAAGLSVGEVALKAGVITADTKTALLVAQAAERAFALSTEAGDIAASYDTTVKQHRETKTRYDKTGTHVVSHTDDVFKYVGSDRDPPVLQQAQSLWMTAQMFYNNEIESLENRINQPGYVGGSASMPGYEAGFQNMALKFYGEAADMLRREGHEDAAGKLEQVQKQLAKGVSPATAKNGPAQFLQSHLWNEQFAAQQVNIILNGDYQSINPQFEKTVYKLMSQLSDDKPKAPERKAVFQP